MLSKVTSNAFAPTLANAVNISRAALLSVIVFPAPIVNRCRPPVFPFLLFQHRESVLIFTFPRVYREGDGFRKGVLFPLPDLKISEAKPKSSLAAKRRGVLEVIHRRGNDNYRKTIGNI